MTAALRAESMHMYRHPEIQIGRPYAFDVDSAGVLWEGQHDGLLTHDSATGRCAKLDVYPLHHKVICSAICFDGQIVTTHQVADHVTVYDPIAAEARRIPLPDPGANVWYGLRAADKLLLIDRGLKGGILVYDSLDTPPRVIPKKHPKEEFGGMSLLPDGRVVFTTVGSLELIFFDPVREMITERRAFPDMDVSLTGSLAHDGKLYLADSAAGRVLVFRMADGKWLEPIPTPDYQKVYGFIGGGFNLGSRAYWCLSTYRFRSRLDPATGELVLPEGWDVGVDGLYPRFLDRLLVFDAATQKFDYLVVPPQPDGTLLLCYSAAVGEKAFITGYLIPHAPTEKPGSLAGDWVVWQNFPAEQKPFNPAGVIGAGREVRAQQLARSVPPSRGLFITEPAHVPPVRNMQGPAFEYPPGWHDALRRRLEVTDAARCWKELAPSVAGSAKTDKERAAAVGRFVKARLYYNPISTHYLGPVAVLASGDARCGQSVGVARALLDAIGLESRVVSLRNHCVAEVFYDGGWHVQDSLIFGGDQPERDGNVLSAQELKAGPYFADAWPLDCFAYRAEELRSSDDFYVLGYTFGEWGSMPYYSGYYGAEWDHPPTLPLTLPAQRGEESGTIKLRWAESIRRGGGAIEYRVRVYEDRALSKPVAEETVATPFLIFRPPQENTMYYYTVAAMDDHRRLNTKTWYPEQRGNFVLAPKEQYGWYGVV